MSRRPIAHAAELLCVVVLLWVRASGQILQNNLDDHRPGVYPPWGWKPVCVAPACNPGGNPAGPISTSQTIDNSYPSLDGESMLLSITAPSQADGTNALWTYVAGAQDDITVSAFDIQVYI